jgi:hypothetical protein
MNDLQIPAKFLVWVLTCITALGLTGALGRLTYRMAEAAIEAQNQSMSYGKFSRELWHKNQGTHDTRRHAK